MRHFDADQIAQLLDYRELVDALVEALADETVTVPQRVHWVTGEGPSGSALLVMPAWRRKGLLIVKLMTVTPANASRGLPTVQGNLHVLELATGRVIATMDAAELTRRRTAAASLLAARLLARPTSESLLVVGAGAIASHLLRAYCAEYRLRRIRIWNRTPARAHLLAATAEVLPGVTVEAIDRLEEAVAEADIVTCATLSDRALIRGAWIRPGTHIDLVGAFTPTMRECDDDLLRRAQIYVDCRQAALTEAGDLVQAIAAGAISESDIRGDLGDLVRGRSAGRDSDEPVTVFKSVGNALEDLAACDLVLRRAALSIDA